MSRNILYSGTTDGCAMRVTSFPIIINRQAVSAVYSTPTHPPTPPCRLYRNGIIAPALLAAFGPPAASPSDPQSQGQGGGVRLTHDFLQLAWGFLARWPAQSDVAESAIGLLRTLLSG